MAQKIGKRLHTRLPYRRKTKDRSNREENVVPMINVIFLLLLYFMVAGNLEPDLDIVLPVSTRNPEANLQAPTVYVAHDGQLWFAARAIDSDELKTALAGEEGAGKLRIHADANVAALVISNIMNVAAEAGIFRFILVTQSGVAAH